MLVRPPSPGMGGKDEIGGTLHGLTSVPPGPESVHNTLRQARPRSCPSEYTPSIQGFMARTRKMAERVGLNQAVFANLCRHLQLHLKSSNDKEFRRLVDVLFLHGFLPSRDAF
jgi:hypothetical protein